VVVEHLNHVGIVAQACREIGVAEPALRQQVSVGTAAVTLLAALGPARDRFPTHRHVASWAGVCPGNTQRGGKRLSGVTTQGNPWLRAILGEVAWAIAHTTGNYWSACSTAWRAAGVSRMPAWPSARASWSSSTRCCATTAPPLTLALIPSTS
jgi:transposase